jgi:hypothetical protein
MKPAATITLSLCLALATVPALASTASQVLQDQQTAAVGAAAAAPSTKTARTAADGAGPSIVLLKPSLSAITRGPVDIQVRFQAAEGSRVEVKSLRVLYGWFGIDVTEKLLAHAQVTADGFIAKDTDLPSGHHKVTVEVKDDRNRIGRKTFRFEIPENQTEDTD